MASRVSLWSPEMSLFAKCGRLTFIYIKPGGGNIAAYSEGRAALSGVSFFARRGSELALLRRGGDDGGQLYKRRLVDRTNSST